MGKLLTSLSRAICCPATPVALKSIQCQARYRGQKKLIFITFRTDFSSIFFFLIKNSCLKKFFLFPHIVWHKSKSFCRCMIFQKFRSALPIFFLSLLTVASPIGHFPEEKPFVTEYTNSFKFAILNEFMTWFIDLKPTII